MIRHCYQDINGMRIFYREAGSPNAPVLVLLHGFPASSHLFRGLMEELSGSYHLIAPDFPGYGFSDNPSPLHFSYSFENLAGVIENLLDALQVWKFSLYLHGFGGAAGFRIATRNPRRIESLILQNTNSSIDGFSALWQDIFDFWDSRNPDTERLLREQLKPESIRWLYECGASNPTRIAPESWQLSASNLRRKGSDRIQLELLHDYRNNLTLYDNWHSYLAEHQPPTLVLWACDDPLYLPEAGADYQRHLPTAEVHYLNGGHFILEEQHESIAGHIMRFQGKNARRREKAGSTH